LGRRWHSKPARSRPAVAVGELYTDQLAGGDRTGLDMVTANFGASSLTQLNGFLGAVTPSASVKSDGAFLAQSDFALGALPTAVAIEDMNGDGFDDVVATVTGVTNAVRVFLGPVQALVEPYGFGCPGTGGTVPVNSAIGLPTIGNANFTDTLSNAAPFHANFLALGVGPANAEYGFTGSGCFLAREPVSDLPDVPLVHRRQRFVVDRFAHPRCSGARGTAGVHAMAGVRRGRAFARHRVLQRPAHPPRFLIAA
jgi:hypothetical protein